MSKLQQTLVVGLGRPGRTSLEHLKRRIEQTYGELPAVKLLVLDVTTGGAGEAEPSGAANLGPTELLELPLGEGPGSGGALTRTAAQHAWHTNLDALYPFLIAQLNEIGSATAWQAMEALGFEVTAERNEATLIVLAGAGDAAGGGLLLDVTYLFEHIFRNAGLQCASSAILFMPPLSGPDPLAEAGAYATFKELNAYMSGSAIYRRAYPGAGVSVESEVPPFNHGCHLIDMRNEKSLTLKDQDELARLAGDWVFNTVLTPLKGPLDEFAQGQGTTLRVQGQLAAYNSFGLAAYVLPIEGLIHWSAAHLSEGLIAEQLLKPELFARVADRLGAFFNKTHLRPDILISTELRQDKDGKPIKLQSDTITRLRTLPHDQVITSVQAAINAIGKEMLPSLRGQIEVNSRRIVQEAGDVIDQEVASVLQQWPAGGLSLAMQLVGRLRDDAGRYAESLTRREAAYRALNQQQVSFLARQGPTLKNAAASIPPPAVAILALVLGVIAPLALASSMLWRTLQDAPEAARIAVLAAAWLLALGGVAYTMWQSIGHVERIRDQYVTYLQNRFETELNLALVQAARGLYLDVENAATFRLDRLDQFSERLHDTARQFKQELGTVELSGEMGFTLQRSVLTPDLIDRLYDHYLGQGGVEGRVPALVDAYGSLDNWLTFSLDDLHERVFFCCKDVFDPMRELRAEVLMKEHMAASQVDAERLVRDLLDKAAPLCVYNVYNLGQVSMAGEKTYVGMEAPGQSEFRRYFERVSPAIEFEPLGDRHSLVVTTLRRGMPLYGLVRMAELRRNYHESIKDGAVPLHLEDELALSPDLKLLPASAVEHAPSDPALVFALSLALGRIRQGASGGAYVVVDEHGEEVAHLACGRTESAVLLGADDKLLPWLDTLIQSSIAERSAVEVVTDLEAYLKNSPVSPWERRRINKFLQLLRG